MPHSPVAQTFNVCSRVSFGMLRFQHHRHGCSHWWLRYPTGGDGHDGAGAVVSRAALRRRHIHHCSGLDFVSVSSVQLCYALQLLCIAATQLSSVGKRSRHQSFLYIFVHRDRLRTVTNVIGDSVGVAVVHHLSRHDFEDSKPMEEHLVGDNKETPSTSGSN